MRRLISATLALLCLLASLTSCKKFHNPLRTTTTVTTSTTEGVPTLEVGTPRRTWGTDPATTAEEELWSAIAYDFAGSWATATNRSTSAEARASALGRCGASCGVFTFQACGAVVIARGPGGGTQIATADTLGAALNKAMSGCAAAFAARCENLTWACTG